MAKDLIDKFYQLLKNGTVEELQNWLTAAKATGIVEIVRFANGIEGDREAVEAAVETCWSNGQVEGQVNKLKTAKRMMCGRAKFDLLRAKVICRN